MSLSPAIFFYDVVLALHIAAIAAVTDVGLVVLGGGIGANADRVFVSRRPAPG